MGLRNSATRSSAPDFFHESSSSKPLIISKAPFFENFLKLCGDIRNSRPSTGVKDTGVVMYTDGLIIPEIHTDHRKP